MKTEFINEKLMAIERNQAFKGYAGQVHITNVEPGNHLVNDKNGNGTTVLTFNNQYLGGYVNYTYDTNKDITSVNEICRQMTPKWLLNKYNNLKTFRINNNKRWEFNEKRGDINYIFSVNEYDMVVEKRYELKGCMIRGHRYNISKLHELNKELSKYRKHIKTSSTEDLIGYHTNNDNHDIADVQTIPLYSKAIRWFKKTVARLFV